MSMSEVEAVRFTRAALALIVEHIGSAAPEVTRDVLALRNGSASLGVDALPPWEPEPEPGTPLPWSQVVPGDSVLAPNGAWYRVDSVARIGEQVKVLLDGKIPTQRRAGESVTVRRGDTGRAVDILRAGGLEPETIGSEG